jgi:hypothetical protein
MLGTDYNRDHPSPKLQLLLHPHEKKKSVKPNQFKWGR